MYEDKLEGRIAPEFFDRKAADLRKQDADLICRANEIRAAEPAPVEDSLNLMDLTSRAAGLFRVQPADEQPRFLRLC